MTRIPGLSTLIDTLVLVCRVIDKWGSSVRVFVPEGDQTAFDNALSGIKAACDVVRAIDYVDSVAGTSPLWGSK